jgi:hypothetical protein
MKTTVEIPDELFRRAKSVAAARGQSLKGFLTEAMAEKLSGHSRGRPASAGWMKLAGSVTRAQAKKIDAVIQKELERIDPADWR